MTGLTKLGFALILILSLALLGLVAELLYLLHCRRRRCLLLLRRSPADPELADPCDGPSPRELLLHVLCFKHRSRVEPAAPPSSAATISQPKPPGAPEAEADAEEECDLAQWRARFLGPSWALYTINEEEEEEEDEDEEEEETPFATPCASPGFSTPSPSPPRAAADAAEDAGELAPAVERR